MADLDGRGEGAAINPEARRPAGESDVGCRRVRAREVGGWRVRAREVDGGEGTGDLGQTGSRRRRLGMRRLPSGCCFSSSGCNVSSAVFF